MGPSREYFFFVLLHAVELDGVRSGWLETNVLWRLKNC
jgi:hypothetical protein